MPKKMMDSSFEDCPRPTTIEIPQICFRHRNEYVDPCDPCTIRVPKPVCVAECTTVERPKLEIGPCELPKICYKERLIDKPKVCLTEKPCEIRKPCFEYRCCQLLKPKACRVDVEIVKPCVKPMKPPKICCDPCPITIPKIELKPVKCCVPPVRCEPIQVECPKFCDKPLHIEMPKICCKSDPIKVTVPVLAPLKLPECPIDCPKPC